MLVEKFNCDFYKLISSRYLPLKSRIFPTDTKSLVSRYLTDDIFNALRSKSTLTGFTLEKAIRSGISNPDSAIGIYAGDAQSYRLLAPIFEPIILNYHGITEETNHVSHITNVDLPDPDPENMYIISSRVRIARSLRGFGFTNHIDLKTRKNIEKLIVNAALKLQNDLKGQYHSFESLNKEKKQWLKKDNLFFEKGDRFQEAAGMNADFPVGRGIFHSNDKRLRIWINEEDHMRIISQNTSSDLGSVFNLLCKALVELEQNLDFEKDDKYGYLTACPTNIGTTMRVGVHIRLKKLSKEEELLRAITKKHDLQIRGTRGEKTEVENAVYDISNRRRLGISETEIITSLHKGVLAIIEAEKNL